jgi:tetraacyldisaccharide 4'-kinase
MAPIALPASWAYGAAVRLRGRRFERGDARRLPLPTISIGNLSAGGTGKTPLTAWATAALRDAGRRPLIAMRGYAARRGEASDEEQEYAVAAPGTPVVVGADRFAAVHAALASGIDADCVVLDDGFQHRRLARDLDLVLVDAQRPLDGPLLPAGWLREPPEALRRADAVVVTRAAAIDRALSDRIEALHGRPPIAWTRHAWRSLALHAPGGATRVEPVAWLRGRRAIGLFGVGHPEALLRAYREAGTDIAATIRVPDHARHGAAELGLYLARLRAEGAEALATTRKDWMKLAPHLAALPPSEEPLVVVPDLAIECIVGGAELRSRIIEAAAGNAGHR